MFGCIAAYPTPQSLQDKVDEYFDWLAAYNEDKPAFKQKPPTMTGLARYLGFTTRTQFINYKNDENPLFEDVINYAKMQIEEFYEEKLIMCKGPSTGLQFALKNNCGWDDKTKTQISGDTDKPLVFMWDDNAKDVIDANPDVQKLDAPRKQIPKLDDGTLEAVVISE